MTRPVRLRRPAAPAAPTVDVAALSRALAEAQASRDTACEEARHATEAAASARATLAHAETRIAKLIRHRDALQTAHGKETREKGAAAARVAELRAQLASAEGRIIRAETASRDALAQRRRLEGRLRDALAAKPAKGAKAAAPIAAPPVPCTPPVPPTAEVAALQAQIDALTTQLAETEGQLAIASAALDRSRKLMSPLAARSGAICTVTPPRPTRGAAAETEARAQRDAEAAFARAIGL